MQAILVPKIVPLSHQAPDHNAHLPHPMLTPSNLTRKEARRIVVDLIG